MVFSSLLFIFAYLAIVIPLYYIMPNTKLRNWVLFVVSLLFYGWGEPLYIFVMLASVLVTYLFGFFIEKHRESNVKRAKLYMILSLSINLVTLFFFKYSNFFIENISWLPFIGDVISPMERLKLPIGISFYTFQIMSYTIDLYRGETRVQKNFVAFGTYVTLFPQLIAGPIVRYRDVDEQLSTRKEKIDLFASGVRRFVGGLAKKVIIGDAIATLYEYFKAGNVFAESVVGAWMIMICYTLHIYYDFSGYSDMAIGLGKMFGFRFLENFNYPYISTSITEFWRRWHMSLSTWFREYVYIPLGGNRGGKRKQYRNIAIVWFLTGFWHGANWNYILWGMYFGIILMVEKEFLLKWLEKTPKIFRHVYALLLIGFGWIIFSYTDMIAGYGCFRSLFGIRTDVFCTPTIGYQVLRAVPLLLIGFIGSTPWPKKMWDKFNNRGKALPWVDMIGTIALLCVCVAYLVDSTYSPFLYFIF